MELMEAIRKRVSVRNFLDAPISDDIITDFFFLWDMQPSKSIRRGKKALRKSVLQTHGRKVKLKL